MSSKVEITELSPLKKGKPTVVTGFTGPGFIGNTALMYVVRQKRFPQLAQVKSHLIPPMMLLIEGNPTPVFRVYGDEKNETLYVISEALIAAENAWPIGIELMRWFKSKGVKKIISVEGMPFAALSGKRPIFGFSMSGENMAQYGVTETKEGGISGINAVLLEEAINNKIAWTTLLVPTPQTQIIDYGGAAAVIDVLNNMFKLGVNPEPLRKSDEMRMRAMKKAGEVEKRGFLDSFRRR